jgi:hypothetical protein
MRLLFTAFFALSIAIGAGGKEALRLCLPNCCGAEALCRCGHNSHNDHDELGGQDVTNNGIPAIPQMPCRTGCFNHAADDPAALDNSEIKISQKSPRVADQEKPSPYFAPFCPTKGAVRRQPAIECLNLRRGPPSPVLGFEKTSTRLTLLSVFRN